MKRILVAGLMLALLVCAVPAMGATYPDQTLSGGYQAGHFNDVWDLTAGDMTLSFTYDGNGLVDDAGTHAWSELGVRSVGSGDFNPMLTVYWTKTIDLFAGQNIDVGNVMIQRVGNLLYITYVTSDNWALTETHLAVGTIDVNGVCTGITQTKKGNPIPGQFPYNMIH
ncbi:MAG: hypothetical protein LUQ42_05310, partial [Methanomicrobiales archaeon]|nr:hypothetical protein [Methanomicrobiales archaeon]